MDAGSGGGAERVLSAKIQKAETRGSHTYYVIAVHAERGQLERKWTIRRRASEFEAMHKELSNLFTKRPTFYSLICGVSDEAVDIPPIPRLRKGSSAQSDPATIQRRGGELNTFLAEVVSRAAFCQSAPVLHFFAPSSEDTVVSTSSPLALSLAPGGSTSRALLSPPPLKNADRDRASSPGSAAGSAGPGAAGGGAASAGGAPSPLTQEKKHTQEYAGALDLDEECAMCCEEFTAVDPAVVTSCNHKFHLHCIMDWKDRNREPLCPMCRRKLAFMEESMQKELEKDEEMSRSFSARISVADEEMARRLQHEEMVSSLGSGAGRLLMAQHAAARGSGSSPATPVGERERTSARRSGRSSRSNSRNIFGGDGGNSL